MSGLLFLPLCAFYRIVNIFSHFSFHHRLRLCFFGFVHLLFSSIFLFDFSLDALCLSLVHCHFTSPLLSCCFAVLSDFFPSLSDPLSICFPPVAVPAWPSAFVRQPSLSFSLSLSDIAPVSLLSCTHLSFFLICCLLSPRCLLLFSSQIASLFHFLSLFLCCFFLVPFTIVSFVHDTDLILPPLFVVCRR